MLDVTWALIIEIYKEYGMKFDEAISELQKRLTDPGTPEGKQARAPDNDASLAMLQSMMAGSDFGGPRG